MRAQDLLELVRKRPFAPFRIHTTEGRNYEIRHPDQVLVLRSRIEMGIGETDDVPEHAEHVALAHIVRIEEIGTKPEPSTN